MGATEERRKATTAEAERAAQARPYDFRQPRLLSQDQARTFARIHEAFAREFALHLSTQIRIPAELELTAATNQRFSEYAASCTNPVALFLVRSQPQDELLLVDLDPRFVVFMVERLFGGVGNWQAAARPISRIERGMMGKVLGHALAGLEAAWRPIASLQFIEAGFEAHAERVQVVAPSEPVLVAEFTLSVQGHQTTMRCCYPYRLIEDLLNRVGRTRGFAEPEQPLPSPERDHFEETVRAVTVELRAVLGQTWLPLTELAQLQPGDVIPLQRRVGEPIDVALNQQRRFKATLGRAGKRCALQITDVLETPRQKDDER